jgi:hypothetical protein
VGATGLLASQLRPERDSHLAKHNDPYSVFVYLDYEIHARIRESHHHRVLVVQQQQDEIAEY